MLAETIEGIGVEHLMVDEAHQAGGRKRRRGKDQKVPIWYQNVLQIFKGREHTPNRRRPLIVCTVR